MRRVLVTGATGFVGGAVARALLARGSDTVRVLARDPDRPEARDLVARGAELVRGDLCREENLAFACDGVDAVVHAASDTRLRDRAVARKAGVDASVALYGLARVAGARRFLFVSTMAVYGGVQAEPPDESHDPVPFGDLYADLKIEAERALRASAGDPDAPGLVVLRFPSVYGPGSPRWTEAPLAQARKGKLTLPGGGAFAFPYLFVDNMVDAVLRALDGEAQGTFDVFDGVVSFREFMGRYARMAGTEPKVVPLGVLRAVARAASLVGSITGRNFLLNPAAVARMAKPMRPSELRARKAAEILGWRPAVDLDAGMARVAKGT